MKRVILLALAACILLHAGLFLAIAVYAFQTSSYWAACSGLALGCACFCLGIYLVKRTEGE